jgi:hypothetical protein
MMASATPSRNQEVDDKNHKLNSPTENGPGENHEPHGENSATSSAGRTAPWFGIGGVRFPETYQGQTSEENKAHALNNPNVTLNSKPAQGSAHPSWVVEHHKNNLVLELKRRETSSIFDLFRKKQQIDAEIGSTGTARWKARRFRVNFSELQSMHMRKLQSKLVEHAIDMRLTLKEKEGQGEWEETLQEYSRDLL